MQETPSGLQVPDGTLDKRHEVWTTDEARLLRRALALLAERGLKLAVGCPACSQMCAPEPNYATGDTQLACGCAERQMVGWWWRGGRDGTENLEKPTP